MSQAGDRFRPGGAEFAPSTVAAAARVALPTQSAVRLSWQCLARAAAGGLFYARRLRSGIKIFDFVTIAFQLLVSDACANLCPCKTWA